MGEGRDAADGRLQDLFRTFPTDTRDETDAAGVVFKSRIIEPLSVERAHVVEEGVVQRHGGEKI